MTSSVSRHLDNKSIVIIGAGRGIGAAVAEYCAGLGASLLVADIDGAAAAATAKKLRAGGSKAESMKIDVSNWDECRALIKKAVDLHGRIDGLANFAGIVYLRTPFDETDGDKARRLFEINLLGTYYVGVNTIQQMKKQGGGGAIVNTTSGVQAGVGSCSAYAASKGGVASLTYCWAMDAAADGIRVNSISPVATSAMTETSDEYMRQHGQLPEGNRPFVDPACNAPAVAFLLSNASSHLNGQILRVHGEQLQLISHPAVLQPVMERDTWDIPSIAKALKDSFGDTFPPLGLTGMRGEFVPLTKVNPVPR